MASSPLVGRRPRISRICRYSSVLRPSAAYGCSRSGVVAAFSTVSTTCVEGVLTGECSLETGRMRQRRQSTGARMRTSALVELVEERRTATRLETCDAWHILDGGGRSLPAGWNH